MRCIQTAISMKKKDNVFYFGSYYFSSCARITTVKKKIVASICVGQEICKVILK